LKGSERRDEGVPEGNTKPSSLDRRRVRGVTKSLEGLRMLWGVFRVFSQDLERLRSHGGSQSLFSYWFLGACQFM